MARSATNEDTSLTDGKGTVVTDEFFVELVEETQRAPRKPNEQMRELLRKTRGSIQHR
jgi:hypothetical protein